MARNNGKIISTLASRLTATVSVTLVLLLLAITGSIAIGTRQLVDTTREELGFVVIMHSEASEAQINAIKQKISHAPYMASYSYASPADIEERWITMTGADSTERAMLASMEVSPFLPEFDVHVKSNYLVSDSLDRIIPQIEKLPGVESVTAHTTIIDNVGTATSRIMVILLIIALALMLISFVLINNTVRLSVYAKRFLINTMSLVGATDGFIRRPFMLSAAFTGLIAGCISDLIFATIMLYMPRLDPEVASLISWEEAGIVLVSLPVIGVVICTLAAFLATNRYLRRSYNQLFK